MVLSPTQVSPWPQQPLPGTDRSIAALSRFCLMPAETVPLLLRHGRCVEVFEVFSSQRKASSVPASVPWGAVLMTQASSLQRVLIYGASTIYSADAAILVSVYDMACQCCS